MHVLITLEKRTFLKTASNCPKRAILSWHRQLQRPDQSDDHQPQNQNHSCVDCRVFDSWIPRSGGRDKWNFVAKFDEQGEGLNFSKVCYSFHRGFDSSCVKFGMYGREIKKNLKCWTQKIKKKIISPSEGRREFTPTAVVTIFLCTNFSAWNQWRQSWSFHQLSPKLESEIHYFVDGKSTFYFTYKKITEDGWNHRSHSSEDRGIWQCAIQAHMAECEIQNKSSNIKFLYQSMICHNSYSYSALLKGVLAWTGYLFGNEHEFGFFAIRSDF